jgi:hypothetical protein
MAGAGSAVEHCQTGKVLTWKSGSLASHCSPRREEMRDPAGPMEVERGLGARGPGADLMADMAWHYVQRRRRALYSISDEPSHKLDSSNIPSSPDGTARYR